MGCKEIKSNANNAVAYNCDHVFEGGCSYKSEKYRLRQVLPPSVALLSCSSSCRCREGGFICSHLRCPEIGQVTLPNRDCHHIYTLNECCNRGYRCPPFDKVPTCEVDGQKYFAGQKFYPKDTNLHCVCQQNFEGKFVAPFCRNIECGIQLKYVQELKNRCAPLYKDKILPNCPSSWFCPNPDEPDKIVKKGKNQNNQLKCFYGDAVLNLNDYFERKELDYLERADNVFKCECVVPPLLTCYITSSIPW
ncbi:hypothetical protein FQR65_LT00630 [Abscondita terminalis]|nr:hypothetical protein FQR65_LT00630 [Abscondita terminalis]